MTMTLTKEQKKALEIAVDDAARSQDQRKVLAADIKATCDATCDKFREHGITPKVFKQLVKERGWDEIDRMAQRQLEETLDQCRTALGMLADLPLGEHAQDRQIRKRAGKAAEWGTS